MKKSSATNAFVKFVECYLFFSFMRTVSDCTQRGLSISPTHGRDRLNGKWNACWWLMSHEEEIVIATSWGVGGWNTKVWMRSKNRASYLGHCDIRVDDGRLDQIKNCNFSIRLAIVFLLNSLEYTLVCSANFINAAKLRSARAGPACPLRFFNQLKGFSKMNFPVKVLISWKYFLLNS